MLGGFGFEVSFAGDDPMSLHEEDTDMCVRKWLQGIWRGRGSVTSEFWRLYFVVVVDG